MGGALAVVPDPPDGPDDLDDQDDLDAAAPSLWEAFAAEAVGPLVLAVPGQRDEFVLHAPARDGVADLDVLDRPQHQLAALFGDGDVAEDLLDALDPLDWSCTLDALDDVRDHFALTVLPAGLWTHLVEQVDCYGAEIEADLADRGHDLLDWFRGLRPWTQLARLLARLPEGSRTVAAVLDDEDLAAQRIAEGLERPDGGGRPGLLGETQDRMLLRAVVSALLRIEHATYAVHAGKGKAGTPPRPLPGPETAEDRVRKRTADTELESLFDQVTPWWRGDDPPPTTDAAPPGFRRRDSGLLSPDT